MKKEKIDDNQLTFFDVIDGGKHEEDKKNIMKFKKKQLIDVQYAPCGRDQPYLQQNPGSPSGSYGRRKSNRG